MKYLVAGLLISSAAFGSIKVPVNFVEALAPRDSTSSLRFQADFEGAIKLATQATKSQLARCGYELETSFSFYDAGDPLQATEKGSSAQSAGNWLIVGPRRSNHYLLLTKGASKTATISLMASASEVKNLGGLHATLSPLNAQMASVAAVESVRRAKKGATYIAFVSADCVNCVDFADQFSKRTGSLGIKEVAQVRLNAELPDLGPLKEAVSSARPDFILIPNYSKTAAHIMAGLSDSFSGFYVGGDGWGDSNFGWVQNGPNLQKIRGFTVRGFPPFEKGIKAFPLGKRLEKNSDLPKSGPALGIIKTVDLLAESLCSQKPKTQADFTRAFEKASGKFQSPWGVSIYELNGGEISFKKTTREGLH